MRALLATEWLQSFEASLLEEHVARNTRVAYLYDVGRFLRWARRAGTPSPLEVRAADVLDYRDGLVFDEGHSSATVSRNLASLRRFFGWLERQGYIGHSPLDAVRNPRGTGGATPLSRTWQEVVALVVVARTTGLARDRLRNELMVTLLAHTGLRLSELVRLRWGDVHLELGLLDVRTHGKRGARAVPLDHAAQRALVTWWRASRAPSDRTFVLSCAPVPLGARTVQSTLEDLGKRAGLRGRVSPHVLRHTFARRYLIRNAGDLAGLAGLLGHASTVTTAAYARLQATTKARKVQAIEE